VLRGATGGRRTRQRPHRTVRPSAGFQLLLVSLGEADRMPSEADRMPSEADRMPTEADRMPSDTRPAAGQGRQRGGQSTGSGVDPGNAEGCR